MASAQVVEPSFANNSPSQNYTHQEDHYQSNESHTTILNTSVIASNYMHHDADFSKQHKVSPCTLTQLQERL